MIRLRQNENAFSLISSIFVFVMFNDSRPQLKNDDLPMIFVCWEIQNIFSLIQLKNVKSGMYSVSNNEKSALINVEMLENNDSPIYFTDDGREISDKHVCENALSDMFSKWCGNLIVLRFVHP